MKRSTHLLIGFFLVHAMNAHSQDGFLDPSFGIEGIAQSDPAAENETGYTVGIAPDGSIVVGGWNWEDQFYASPILRAFTQDGALITNFGNNGLVVPPFSGPNPVSGLAVQEDGKVIAIGDGYGVSFLAARFLLDGSIDSSFGVDGTASVHFPWGGERTTALAIQPDGAIILVGHASAPTDISPNCMIPALCRLLPDGALDPNFGTAGLVTFPAPGITANQYTSLLTDIVTAADGTIFGCGFTTAGISVHNFFVTKLNAQGVPDPAFGAQGSAVFEIGALGDVANSLALLPDARVLVTGHAVQQDTKDAFLLRLNADGGPDPSFGDGGTAIFSLPGNDDKWNSVHALPDGRIITTGTSGVHDPDYPTAKYPTVARYLQDGSMDPSFGSSGYSIFNDDEVGSAALSTIQPDGRIVIAGWQASMETSRVTVYRVLNSPLNTIAEDRMDVPRIYPNPATDHLHLIWPGSIGQAQRVDITDAAGRVVFTRQLSAGLASPLGLPVANLATGSYTVRVTGDRSIACAKFIKY